MNRVAVFDWTAGGHRTTYIRRVVEALRGSAELLLALPEPTLEELGQIEAITLSLGAPRPAFSGRLRRREVLEEEVSRLRDVAAQADHTLHLFADHPLFKLTTTRPLPATVSIVLYYPRWHYGAAFGTPLPASDRAVALAKELAVRAWRRRSDAGTVFTLDEDLARRWQQRPGAPAHWLPEPPVARLPSASRPSRRTGCIVYGALAPRKGIEFLTRAITIEPATIRVVIAGAPDHEYLADLKEQVRAMTEAGAEVALRAHPHSEQEGLAALAGAKCAVLPYPRHPGMSRVLLESCSVGTPVVADRFGLLGHLVRHHGLGLTVDASQARALRTAIEMLVDGDAAASYAVPLARFAERFSPSRFRQALSGGLGISNRGAL